MLERSHLRAPGCGGHAIAEFKRTLVQCQIDARLHTSALTALTETNTIYVEIGSKFASVAGRTLRTISSFMSHHTKGYDPNHPHRVICDFRDKAGPHPVSQHRIDVCMRRLIPAQV